MAQAALPLMIASTAVQAAGQFMSGQAQAGAYSQDARNQAQQARIGQQQSIVRAGQIQDETTRRIGAQSAAYGGAGVERTGTPLQVMADTAQRGAMAMELAKYQGKVESLSHLEQADSDERNAKAARLASVIQPIGTVLGGAARAAAFKAGDIPSSDAG